jgi:hypothetical protein
LDLLRRGRAAHSGRRARRELPRLRVHLTGRGRRAIAEAEEIAERVDLLLRRLLRRWLLRLEARSL